MSPEPLVGWAELPVPEHSAEEARRQAEEVLSRPDYEWDEPSDDPLQGILSWIDEQVSKVLAGVGMGDLPPWVAWTALAILVVAVVALVVVLVRRRGAGRRAGGRPTAAGGDAVVIEPEPATGWGAEARRAAAEGRWRDAVRCTYRALVVDLAAAGALGDRAERTSGELATDLARSRPPAAEAFADATALFEATWYGGARAGPDDLQRLDALAGQVRDRARPAPGAAR